MQETVVAFAQHKPDWYQGDHMKALAGADARYVGRRESMTKFGMPYTRPLSGKSLAGKKFFERSTAKSVYQDSARGWYRRIG